MEETILFPSINWFQASGLTVSSDGWLVYGGSSKSLCVLEPLPPSLNDVVGDDRYRAHVLRSAHKEKIVSVDIAPEWPEKKNILSGSADGSVKQWSMELVNNKYKIKYTHGHDVHFNDKEEVAGVAYSNEVYAVTVGCYGNIVKWDLNSNVIKTYNNFLKNFKPTCMSCSQHIALNLAVGTKQGVIFVLDLNGSGKILYKVRGQDDEIVKVSWCPQYEVTIKKYLKDSEKRLSANERMSKIRQGAEDAVQNLNQSAVAKKLPDDSFDESIVQEDDMFDIYKDHEKDEFGPKKYEPEDILVKVKEEVKSDISYLDECMKLKEEILKRKNEPEPSIASLVEAFENTHVENESKEHSSNISQTGSNEGESSLINDDCEASVHIHKHVLATIGKHGGVRIWSKTGKLVGSCVVPNAYNKNQRGKTPTCSTLLWYKPDTLLIADGKSQLLQCNPLKIDCKNKLEFEVIHSIHKRGLFCIASDAPKIQLMEETNTKDQANNWSVWTVAQDRNIVRYSLVRKQKISIHATCGGFVYSIQTCPYDAKKLAIGVGDGAVRVWEADTTDEDEMKLCSGNTVSYWQNVQGKVLTVAWHPTKENLLAFGTAESRVGLIDTNGRTERAARTLVPAQSGGVYSLCWGDDDQLFVCARGQLSLYRTNCPDQPPEAVEVSVEGQRWETAAVRRAACGALCCGSAGGAVAVLRPAAPRAAPAALAATYVFTKMIYSIEWHPQQTSESNDESPYKNLIAVTSVDKQNVIAILEYGDKEDGTKQLQLWKTLSGHTSTVFVVAWNPHRDELLLSTSQDSTVRVWDIVQGACLSVFGGHQSGALCAAWSARPQLHSHVLSGGGDCCVRLWRAERHPAAAHAEADQVSVNKKDKKKQLKEKKEEKKAEETKNETAEGQAHITSADKIKVSKKYLLPIIYKQLSTCQIQGARAMLEKYMKNCSERFQYNLEVSNNCKENAAKRAEDIITTAKDISSLEAEVSTNNKNTSVIREEVSDAKEVSTEGGEVSSKAEVQSTENKDVNKNDKDLSVASTDISKEPKSTIRFGDDFVKMFGCTNEVNEILDMEMDHHLNMGNMEAWIMLSIFRGHIDSMIQLATQRDLLCPYLISISPCVSFKYWKDATQLYLAQIDRMIAKGEEEKLLQNRSYGGTVYRKVGLLLSVHDVKGAVATLIESRLFKEAYILCRTRHMDSIAEETLQKWAKDSYNTGCWTMAAICNIALGDISRAATVLGKSNDQDCLSLAADLAKVVGHTTFADHIEERKSNIKSKETVSETDNALKELPSRMELLMKEKIQAPLPHMGGGDSEAKE